MGNTQLHEVPSHVVAGQACSWPFLRHELNAASQSAPFEYWNSDPVLLCHPLAAVASPGVSRAIVRSGELAVFAGPCLIPQRVLRRLIFAPGDGSRCDGRQLISRLEDLNQLPSLNSILNVGAYFAGARAATTTVFVILETLEYARLLLCNDRKLIDQYGEQVLQAMETVARRAERMVRRLHSYFGTPANVEFLYTHHAKVADLVDAIVANGTSATDSLRESRYPKNIPPTQWGGLRVEAYYTATFTRTWARNCLGTNAEVVLCEDWRNFTPILCRYALPLSMFSIDKHCSWMGLLPIPDSEGVEDMHTGAPVYIGTAHHLYAALEAVVSKELLAIVLWLTDDSPGGQLLTLPWPHIDTRFSLDEYRSAAFERLHRILF